MLINYLREEELQHKFVTYYRSNGIYFEASLSIQITLEELEMYTPSNYKYTVDEDDGLGLRDKWFGSIDDLLFIINHYGEENLMIETCCNQENYKWTILDKLKELQFTIKHRIIWINGNGSEATKSLFYYNQHGIVCELYRANSEKEAIELLKWLNSISTEYQYFIDEPEDLNSIWVTIKKSVNYSDQIVGRFNSRYSCEQLARKMSLANNNLFYVKEEGGRKRMGLSFFKGKKVN